MRRESRIPSDQIGNTVEIDVGVFQQLSQTREHLGAGGSDWAISKIFSRDKALGPGMGGSSVQPVDRS